MQLYLGLAVLSVALVAITSQVIPGGETLAEEEHPNVQEAKGLVFQELQTEAKNIPGNPSVEMTNFVAKKQIVAGTRYNLSFKAVYIYQSGEKHIKSCTASVIKPLGPEDSKITFTTDTDPKEKVKCV